MRHVMVLKDERGHESNAFFVDIVAGEVRVRSAALWDTVAGRYIEADFDLVTQTLKPRQPY